MASIHVVPANLQKGTPTAKAPGGMHKVAWQREQVSSAARVLGRLNADILALQEVKEPVASGSLVNPIVALGKFTDVIFLPLRGGKTLTGQPKNDVDLKGNGIALASRYPIGAREMIELPLQDPNGSWLKTLRTKIGLGEMPRRAILAEILSPDGPILVAATHIAFTPVLQDSQLRTVSGTLDGFARRNGKMQAPRLILGDLNIRGERPLALTGYDSMAEADTYPATAPTAQIDHILVQGGQARSAEAVYMGISDHRALRANVVF